MEIQSDDTKILSYLSENKGNEICTRTEHVKISDYDKLLKSSINLGCNWLHSRVFSLKILKGNTLLHVESLKKKLLEYGNLDGTFNQFIIDMCHKWNSYLKIISDQSYHDDATLNYFSKPPSKTKRRSVQICGASDPPIENIIKDDYLLVEVSPGRFHKFVYIEHDDHYDYLPMWYVLDIYPELLDKLSSGI